MVLWLPIYTEEFNNRKDVLIQNFNKKNPITQQVNSSKEEFVYVHGKAFVVESEYIRHWTPYLKWPLYLQGRRITFHQMY